jgi:hypothetical protein
LQSSLMTRERRSGGALIRPQHRNLISNKNHNCNARPQARKWSALFKPTHYPVLAGFDLGLQSVKLTQ